MFHGGREREGKTPGSCSTSMDWFKWKIFCRIVHEETDDTNCKLLRQEGPRLNHRQKNLRTRDTMSTEEQTFVQKFKPPPSKVDKTRKIALRHVEVRGVSKEKGRCQTTHIEKTCRRISHRLLEDHDPQECLFSIFNSTFDAGQKSSHTDYMQLSIQSQFNTNPSRKRRIPNKGSRFVVHYRLSITCVL